MSFSLLHLIHFASSFAMSHLDCLEVSDEALEVTEHQLHRSRRTLLEFLYIMSAGTLVHITCSMRERLTAANQAVCGVHSTSCSSSCTSKQSVVGGGLQNLRVGTKEGLSETGMFRQPFHDPCESSITEEPSKRSKHLGHLVDITEKKFEGEGSGPRATGLFTICLLLSVVNVDASTYRGVGKHKNSIFFHCETTFLGSLPREKVWVGKFPTEKMAALACDVAFFYTGMPSKRFNFKWSEEVILNFCIDRSYYTDLNNWDDRRSFIKAQANALVSLVPDFHSEDIILMPTDRVPTSREQSEWIAGRIVHHFRNQPWRVQEFMTWFMNPSTERRILDQVHIQNISPAINHETETDDDLIANMNMNLNDIPMRLESLEARPGGNLWLLLFFGGALPFIFKLFESKRMGGEYGDTDLTYPDSRQSWLQIAFKKQKVDRSDAEYFNIDQAWLTAINYHIEKKKWRCTGFDLHSKTWRTLPPFSPTFPVPDEGVFKEHFVCGHGGLMCADVSKLPHKDKLVVFNPLTRKTFALPPLLYPRRPVLVHMLVDSESKSYKVIAAGSSTWNDEHLSKKMEVFDSKTSRWEEASDLPGPAFGLNEYQSGVCVDGVLYFIAFLEGDCGKGVVAFDVENRKWLNNMARPIPFFSENILQLAESDGQVYLFSEQIEQGRGVKHCIDLLVISNPEASAVEKCHWKNVVRVPNSSHVGVASYHEYTCVSFGDGKLCVFNTLKRDGVVYDMHDGRQCEVLQPPPSDRRGELDRFFSTLNPVSFTLQLSVTSDPVPSMEASDPLPQNAASDPFPEDAGSDPLPPNASSDPLPEDGASDPVLPPDGASDANDRVLPPNRASNPSPPNRFTWRNFFSSWKFFK